MCNINECYNELQSDVNKQQEVNFPSSANNNNYIFVVSPGQNTHLQADIIRKKLSPNIGRNAEEDCYITVTSLS